MNFLNFLFPYIETVTGGKFLRRFFSVLYKVFGWTFLVGGVIAMLMGFFAAFKTEQVLFIIGSVFTAPLMAIGGYVLLQLSLYRSKTIDELTGEDYTAIPLISVFTRYLGEVYFTIIVVQGLAMLIGSLFVTNSFFNPLTFMMNWMDMPMIHELQRSSGGAFMAVLLVYVLSLVMGILTLLFFYFLAEMMIVLAEIASNTRRMTGNGLIQASSTVSDLPIHATEPIAPPPISDRICQKCNWENKPGDMFCSDCGNKL